MDFRSMSCFLGTLSGCELVILSSIIACSIAQDLDPSEINILGNFLSALGAQLSTIASVEEASPHDEC